jgi:hypothetical protein
MFQPTWKQLIMYIGTTSWKVSVHKWAVFHDWQMKNEKSRMKLHLNSMNYHMKYHISVINLQSCQKTHTGKPCWNSLEPLWKPMGNLNIQKTISKWFHTNFVPQSFILVSRVLHFHIHILLLMFNLQKKIPNCFPKGELCNLKLLPRLQTMHVSRALSCHLIEIPSPKFSPIISNFHGFNYLCTIKIYAQSEY